MSLEETGYSENRNNLNYYPAYRHANNCRQSVRKCSFCKATGHIVTNCNNTALIYFEYLCILQKEQIEQTETLLPLIMYQFADWLSMYSLDNTSAIIRAFSVRKCGARMSLPIHTCIELITIYIFELTNNNDDYINYQPPNVNIPVVLDNVTARHMSQILESLLILQNVRKEQNVKFNINIVDEISDCNEDNECDKECSICYDTKLKKDFVKLDCNHQFCGTCITNIFQKHSLENIDVPKCALCRSNISTIKCQSENIKNDLTQFIDLTNN